LVGPEELGAVGPELFRRIIFDHLELAVAFGRAARMSGTDIASYGIYEAAHELLYEGSR
jgi:hypothetical protein